MHSASKSFYMGTFSRLQHLRWPFESPCQHRTAARARTQPEKCRGPTVEVRLFQARRALGSLKGRCAGLTRVVGAVWREPPFYRRPPSERMERSMARPHGPDCLRSRIFQAPPLRRGRCSGPTHNARVASVRCAESKNLG